MVWLQPYTEDTLKELAKRGLRKLTVVSPSFAVDCLETLEEVAIEYRDKFPRARRRTVDSGARAQRSTTRHAEVLASIVRSQLKGWI